MSWTSNPLDYYIHTVDRKYVGDMMYVRTAVTLARALMEYMLRNRPGQYRPQCACMLSIAGLRDNLQSPAPPAKARIRTFRFARHNMFAAAEAGCGS